MNALPLFATHYHRATRPPFLNLCDLTEQQLESVLAGLASPGEQEQSARRFGPRYMALRRATEARVRDLFVAAGGTPERITPHYFVLGVSAWFAGLYRDVAEVRVPLSALPSDVTSVTYADSITAMGLGVPYGLPQPDPRHAGRVYRLEELNNVIGRDTRPDDIAPDDLGGYEGHQHQLVDAYVEIQLWSDTPLRHITRNW